MLDRDGAKFVLQAQWWKHIKHWLRRSNLNALIFINTYAKLIKSKHVSFCCIKQLNENLTIVLVPSTTHDVTCESCDSAWWESRKKREQPWPSCRNSPNHHGKNFLLFVRSRQALAVFLLWIQDISWQVSHSVILDGQLDSRSRSMKCAKFPLLGV